MISEDEKARLNLQADRLVELLSMRYGVDPQDVVEAVRWVKEHREWSGKFKLSAWIGLAGVLISSLLIALWEGIRSMVLKP